MENPGTNLIEAGVNNRPLLVENETSGEEGSGVKQTRV